VAIRIYDPGVTSVPLLAVPFFIFAGNLFDSMGLSRRIWDFTQHLVVIGGRLGHVLTVAEMILSGISGSALADEAALVSLRFQRWNDWVTEAVCSGPDAQRLVLGPIIPPSINMLFTVSLRRFPLHDSSWENRSRDSHRRVHHGLIYYFAVKGLNLSGSAQEDPPGDLRQFFPNS